jgi:hypothetical protein
MFKYVELNRSVEAHSECILILSLLDETGAPVPNVILKIWAGPPPTGRPPYYEDVEANSPRPHTDLNGKFQFIVANSAPAQPLDFYVQPVGQDDNPQSEPVHFPFPPHEGSWVQVTMAPDKIATHEASQAPTLASIEADRVAGSESELPTAGGKAEVNHVPALPSGNESATGLLASSTLPPGRKLFVHYLLFGPGAQAATLTNLIIALDYIIRYAPLVGFSPDEARHAEHVTIVGDTLALPLTLEQSLRDAGCIVARLSASDSYALEDAFKHLIDSGTPYPRQ